MAGWADFEAAESGVGSSQEKYQVRFPSVEHRKPSEPVLGGATIGFGVSTGVQQCPQVGANVASVEGGVACECTDGSVELGGDVGRRVDEEGVLPFDLTESAALAIEALEPDGYFASLSQGGECLKLLSLVDHRGWRCKFGGVNRR